MKKLFLILCLCIYNATTQDFGDFPWLFEDFVALEYQEHEISGEEFEFPGYHEHETNEMEFEVPTEYQEHEGVNEYEYPEYCEHETNEMEFEFPIEYHEHEGVEECEFPGEYFEHEIIETEFEFPTEVYECEGVFEEFEAPVTEVEETLEEETPIDPEGPLYPIEDEQFSGYLSSRNFLDLDVQDVLDHVVQHIIQVANDLPQSVYQAFELHYGFRSYEGYGDIEYYELLFEFSNCEGLNVRAWADVSLNPYTGAKVVNSYSIYKLFPTHGPLPDNCPAPEDPTYTNLIDDVDTSSELQDLIDFGIRRVETLEGACLSQMTRKIYAANSRVINGETHYQFNVGLVELGSLIARAVFDVTYGPGNEKQLAYYSYRLIFDDVSGHSSYEDDPTCYNYY